MSAARPRGRGDSARSASQEPGSSIVAPDVVETPLEQRFLDRLREVTGEVDGVMERHGLRCFLLLERLATRRGIEIDREIALCAALVHDIGIYPSASHGGVYTDESGELAAALFAEAGAAADRARICADACAFHHALREQWARGAEVELLRRADLIEVSGGRIRNGLPREEIREVFASVPRDGFYAGIGALLVRALRERPLTVPRIFRLSRGVD